MQYCFQTVVRYILIPFIVFIYGIFILIQYMKDYREMIDVIVSYNFITVMVLFIVWIEWVWFWLFTRWESQSCQSKDDNMENNLLILCFFGWANVLKIQKVLLFACFLVIKYTKMFVISVVTFQKCIFDDIYLQNYTNISKSAFFYRL